MSTLERCSEVAKMWRNVSRAASFGVFLVVATAAGASADPLVVRSGSFSFDTGDPEFITLVGDGFNIHFGGFDAIDFRWTFPQACLGSCPTGTVLDLSTSLNEITGFVRSGGVAGGVTYPQLFLSGDLSFATGTVTVPPVNAFTARLSTPFRFSGHLSAFTDAQRQNVVFDHDVAGSGQARLLLHANCDFSNCVTPLEPFSFLAMDYIFENAAPVPEPASLLLIGGGLVLAGMKVRRRLTVTRRS